MADIFISYAREDRSRIEPLAHALEAQGWSVWWDPRLRAGRVFENQIAKALADARCIVVAWSNTSVKLNWVCDEAQDGLDRNILVPVLLEAVTPPYGFRRIHAVDLSDWRGRKSHAGLEQLLKTELPEILNTGGTTKRTSEIQRQSQPSTRESVLTAWKAQVRVFGGVLLLVGILAAGLAVRYLMSQLEASKNPSHPQLGSNHPNGVAPTEAPVQEIFKGVQPTEGPIPPQMLLGWLILDRILVVWQCLSTYQLT